MDAKAQYLELMKRILTNQIYQDPPAGPHYLVGRAYDDYLRATGQDWPSVAHTMVGSVRLDHVQSSVEYILGNGIKGDLVEAGVWRGGVCIFMRALLDAYRDRTRTVWVADSFQGMPESDDPGDSALGLERFNDILSVSQEEVKENFRRYNLLDSRVRFVPGWFEESLSEAPIDEIALLRLDGDLRTSTMAVLQSLYSKVSDGGIVIVDDYNISVCSAAVEEFRNANSITDQIYGIDDSAVWWCKNGDAAYVRDRKDAASSV